VWGAEWNLLGDLTRLRPDNVVFEESGRHMEVNSSLLPILSQLFYYSASMCAVQAFILAQLLIAHRGFVRYFRLTGGTATSHGGSSSGSAASTAAGESTPLQQEMS